MVSEKIIVVILIAAIVLSLLSIVLTTSLNISTPVTVIGEPKTKDTGSAKVKLFIEPTTPPTG